MSITLCPNFILCILYTVFSMKIEFNIIPFFFFKSCKYIHCSMKCNLRNGNFNVKSEIFLKGKIPEIITVLYHCLKEWNNLFISFHMILNATFYNRNFLYVFYSRHIDIRKKIYLPNTVSPWRPVHFIQWLAI